ncbi:hypothetical protein [Sphingobacterium detergens]|nr:hypothetical protein [Sphingobacterium detergens]
MKKFFFVAFCLLNFQIFAQSITSDRRINNYSFEDNFDDNKNEWSKDSDKDSAVTATIGNGLLKITNKKSNGNWAYYNKNVHIDYSKDFEIQASFVIREVSKKYKTALSIYWGYDDSLGSTWLSISRRRITIKNCYGGDHKHDKIEHSKNNHPALKKGTSYKVTVLKRNDKYLVYLNSKLQVELFYSPLKGNELALAAWENTEIEFYNLKAYNLE